MSDLISRQETLSILSNLNLAWVGYEKVSRLPTIDAVPVKHAKLVNPNPFGECSICGYLIDIRQEYNYCPNCGAKMDGGKDDV